jgi:hypothetical protein
MLAVTAGACSRTNRGKAQPGSTRSKSSGVAIPGGTSLCSSDTGPPNHPAQIDLGFNPANGNWGTLTGYGPIVLEHNSRRPDPVASEIATNIGGAGWVLTADREIVDNHDGSFTLVEADFRKIRYNVQPDLSTRSEFGDGSKIYSQTGSDGAVELVLEYLDRSKTVFDPVQWIYFVPRPRAAGDSSPTCSDLEVGDTQSCHDLQGDRLGNGSVRWFMARQVGPDGAAVRYLRDARYGRITSVVNPWQKTVVTLNWDWTQLLLSSIVDGGDQGPRYSYQQFASVVDDQGNPLLASYRLVQKQVFGSVSAPTLTTTWGYNDQNQITSITGPNGLVAAPDYDPATGVFASYTIGRSMMRVLSYGTAADGTYDVQVQQVADGQTLPATDVLLYPSSCWFAGAQLPAPVGQLVRVVWDDAPGAARPRAVFQNNGRVFSKFNYQASNPVWFPPNEMAFSNGDHYNVPADGFDADGNVTTARFSHENGPVMTMSMGWDSWRRLVRYTGPDQQLFEWTLPALDDPARAGDPLLANANTDEVGRVERTPAQSAGTYTRLALKSKGHALESVEFYPDGDPSAGLPKRVCRRNLCSDFTYDDKLRLLHASLQNGAHLLDVEAWAPDGSPSTFVVDGEQRVKIDYAIGADGSVSSTETATDIKSGKQSSKLVRKATRYGEELSTTWTGADGVERLLGKVQSNP